MSARDAVLVVGSALIGSMAWLVWRDLWLTTATILLAAPIWALIVRTVWPSR